jgi:hypothetical protein
LSFFIINFFTMFLFFTFWSFFSIIIFQFNLSILC